MRRALLSAFVLLGIFAAPAHATAGPSPGSPGLGDRLFPELGNGGYDALHYDVDLRYATSAPTQPIDGTVTMVARARQALSRFDLDFAGASVGAVAVDGQHASFRRVDGELVITPRQPIRSGGTFLVTVSHYVAVPTAPDNSDFSTEAFFYTPDGSATAGQPNFANYFLPSNDHPSDKADLQRYHGGALVLYALRQVVGAATFQRIERGWVQRYEGQSATTDDFIALASQVSGRNLTGFLRDWLYGTKTPPMPGHPDWTVDPVAENQAQALSVLVRRGRG